LTESELRIARKKIGFNVSEALNKSSWKKFKSKSSDYFARDTKLEGFFIKVYKSGTKSYGCRARLGGVGKPKQISLGHCDVTDFNVAKEKAKELIYSVKYEGVNPKEKIRTESLKQKTLLDLADDYIAIRFPKSMSAYTKKDYPARMKSRMPSLIKMSVTEITIDDVQSWWKKSKQLRSDQVAFGYARKLFAQALVKEYVTENVFETAKELIGEFDTPEPRTERHVNQDDMSDFFHAFREVSAHIPLTMRDYAVFVLITGKRKGESSSLKWSNVKWEQGVVVLDKVDTKKKKVDVIPMTNLLYFLLRSRYEARGETQSTRKHSKWVFQSRAGDGYIVNPYKAFNQIADKLAKTRDIGFAVRPHDLRRTFSTATKELGIPKEDLAVLLNHTKADVTDSYIYTGVEYKRTKLKQVEEYMNRYGSSVLNYMAVNWYGMNSVYFDPANEPTKEQKGMSFTTRMNLKSAMYEDEFEGFGFPEWEPSKRLIDAGYIHDENFFKE
jgi:integrase